MHRKWPVIHGLSEKKSSYFCGVQVHGKYIDTIHFMLLLTVAKKAHYILKA